MDSKTSRDVFQYVLMGIFILAAAVSVFVLATYKPKDLENTGVQIGTLIMWGPALGGSGTMRDVLEKILKDNNFAGRIDYVAKDSALMYRDLVEAVAGGSPPDLLFLEGSSLLEMKDQIQPVPYESFTLRQFRDTYVEGAELFALTDGIYALPILVDPLVLYWNRDLFTNALVTQVPADWDTFVNSTPRFVKLDGSAGITQSAISFGEYANVHHAREILSALFMQAGTPIVAYNDDGAFVSRLAARIDESDAQAVEPAALALTFYTDFANPRKTVYSWNKTLPRSQEAFATNKVAMYAGLASEASVLASINPQLNFDVALFPQSARGRTRTTYGAFYGIAAVKQSKNVQQAFTALPILTNVAAVEALSTAVHLPSVRRDMLGGTPTDPFAEVLARSAIIARSWLVPPTGGAINELFAQMVARVTSGQQSAGASVQRASQELDVLLTSS